MRTAEEVCSLIKGQPMHVRKIPGTALARATGEIVYTPPTPAESRARTLAQLKTHHPTTLRLTNPHRYPVGLEPRLADLRTTLIRAARSTAQSSS